MDKINYIKRNVNNNSNFDENVSKYIASYNYLLKADNFVDNIIDENNNKNIMIKMFLVNENNKNNKLNYIYHKFIEYQNNFITILKKYFSIKNFDEIEVINVQEATEKNIPKISSTDDEFLEILINNSSIFENNKKEVEYEFDFKEIENELFDIIIPGLKSFNANKIRIMKYKDEENNEIDEQLLNDFNKRYKPQNINQNQKIYIKEFIEKNKEKKNLILLSFQYLMSSIISIPRLNEDTNLNEVIDKLSKNNNKNEKIELIKSFLSEQNIEQNESVNQNVSEHLNTDTIELMNDSNAYERVDTVGEMNGSNENEDFRINNLYSIICEIKNK